ncbi:tetraacyldisaccharide 4'-kinase [Portibacter lacus]|uniref:Tetraacyldisaccharide 4'-kinase n=1 Tax=Portibacter lacus TaxID=1099794 RepID=A0AA37WFN8_9BACT|nr:tetraacyldisaccharide 4'-kinase [Portibacter lacus]GLR18822.1 tetraacyldisaccharide 4'-kinase [Portibacter lacus]
MVQNVLVKLLLSPFSLLYGLIISMRNFFFHIGLIKRSSFNIPVINIGNLSIGGAGKTPHVEYLIRLLKPYINTSVLSRGYGRKSKGFLFVEPGGNANDFGDEPLQYKRKNKDLVVAVSESRALGIPEMIKNYPTIHTVLLDDAFQHLAVEASLDILLTEQTNLFTDDYLLPSGRLREWRSAYKRADIIIVTKCRPGFDEEQKASIIDKIKPEPNQKIFFSHYVYGDPYNIYNAQQRVKLDEHNTILMVSAIANTDYLSHYLESLGCELEHIQFEDHHYFTEHEVSVIKETYEKIENPNKILLSSEKDAMRLDLHQKFIVSNQIPIFALPIKVEFLFEEGKLFDEAIKSHLINFKI